MVEFLALLGIMLASGWLVFVAGTCLLAPARARNALAAMGSTWPIQIGEHVLRGIAGLALVLRADASKLPMLFEYAGWFILASSGLILLLPRRWHHGYSLWFAERIPLWFYRAIAMPTVIFAAALVYAAL